MTKFKAKHVILAVGLMAALPIEQSLAHDDVSGLPADVAARMTVMTQIKDAMAPLGGMAKGAVVFDADAAQAAVASLLDASERTAAAFEANVSDPKSEALPAIWENWDDFVAKADDLTFAAESWDVSSLDRLRAGMGNIGAACSACHKSYRMKK